MAARVALALPEAARSAFSRAVYAAEFGLGRSIADRALLAGLLADLGEAPEAVFARAESPDNKLALKAAGEEARALGLPGSPCCVTSGGEVFWGNDRLEQAVAWAARETSVSQSDAAAL